MQSHKSCRYAKFLPYYFQTSWLIEQMQSHISCMCVVFSNDCWFLCIVCHKIFHVLLCPLGFSVASLSPFIKWLWLNDCFSVIFQLYQFTQAFSKSYIHRSRSEIRIFQAKWPKSTRSILISRKITNTNSAAILSTDLPSWKPTWWFTAERSLLFVHSATILATKLVPLESILELWNRKVGKSGKV